jgi:hypothetical protein
LVEPGDTKTGFTGNRILTESFDIKNVYGMLSPESEVYSEIAASKESPYQERFQHSLKRMEHDEQNGAPPEAVAKVIYRMIRKKNPPIRAAVGFQYKAIVFLKRILPARLAEMVVGLIYNS